MTRQLHLGAFMRPISIHTGARRYPGAWPDANFHLAHIWRLIGTLEAAKFGGRLKRSHMTTSFEPFTLLSALAKVTERIGLVATASTTYDEPYHVARRFASLGHIKVDAPAGTSSPPAIPRPRATSTGSSTRCTPTTTGAHATSTT